METAVITCIIVLASVIVCILVLLGVLFYNQMLVTNEVNKRLLLIAKESIDKERSTQEELQSALVELERTTNEQVSVSPSSNDQIVEDINEEPFNPHTFNEN